MDEVVRVDDVCDGGCGDGYADTETARLLVLE